MRVRTQPGCVGGAVPTRALPARVEPGVSHRGGVGVGVGRTGPLGVWGLPARALALRVSGDPGARAQQGEG